MKMKHFIWASAMITLLCYTTNSLNAQNMKKEEVLQNPSVFPIGDAKCEVFYRAVLSGTLDAE